MAETIRFNLTNNGHPSCLCDSELGTEYHVHVFKAAILASSGMSEGRLDIIVHCGFQFSASLRTCLCEQSVDCREMSSRRRECKT